jgi:prepilin-type N-terminal cleavage/methylation domain-containing protein
MNLAGSTAHLPRRARAFTLLELLLAVMVFSVVLLSLHYVFNGALRLRNKVVTGLEEAVPLQQALAIIQRDLANLAAPGGTLVGALQTMPTNLTPLVGRSSPYFHTTVGVLTDTAPWPALQRVAYRLVPPTNDTEGLDLMRAVTRNLLATVEEPPEDQFLVGGVEELVFQFHDGTQWRDSWDSTVEPTVLPAAIKAQLYLARGRTNLTDREPVELVVPVFVQPATNTTQTSGGAS